MTAEQAVKINGIRARLDDWVNPIVVKELRQAVQSRFVIAAILALLSIQVVAVGIFLLTSSLELLGFDAGRQVFLLLFGILLGVAMLFVPLYSAIRLISERSETNVDLLFITTIKPRSIIAGKMTAAVVLNILIFSACMPFMAFTYFLRGIDLQSIFIVLALGFLVVVACAQIALLLASLPLSRVFKAGLGLIVLWGFTMIYFFVLAGAREMLFAGVGSMLNDPDFWRGAFGALLYAALSIGLFFTLSVALITPHAANRAFPVRMYISCSWIVTGAIAFIWSAVEENQIPIILWMVAFMLILSLALFAAVSERDEPGRRVLRAIPESGLKRLAAFFTFSGAANGLAWAIFMIGLTWLAVWIWGRLFPHHKEHSDFIGARNWLGLMCLYFYCYALSASFLRRRLLGFVGSNLTWLIGAVLMFAGSVLPFLFGYLIFFHEEWWKNDYGRWLVGNPFIWSEKNHRVLYLVTGVVWALLVTALSAPWFIERVRKFRKRES